jgi:hypothetical protein
MSKHDYIPQGDAEFLEWATILMRNLEKSLERFGFPMERYAQLKQLLDIFIQKFKRATSPGTRTKTAVRVKNSARDALKKAIRQAVKEYLTHNHVLTEEDRDALGLPIHKTSRIRVGIPDGRPQFSIVQLPGSRLKVHFHALDNDGTKSFAKPPGVHAIEIVWALLDAPPEAYEELIHSVTDSRSPHVFQFDLPDAGKRFYCCARWENTRCEKGPWSEIQSVIVP